MGWPSGPVVTMGPPTELVVELPFSVSVDDGAPSLGVGVEAGGRLFGVELGLG